jgi:hypothetical protein
MFVPTRFIKKVLPAYTTLCMLHISVLIADHAGHANHADHAPKERIEYVSSRSKVTEIPTVVHIFHFLENIILLTR